MKKRISDADIILFEELTETALGEEDGTAFIGFLMQREDLARRFAGSPGLTDRTVAERLFEKEMLVIQRLEEERMKLLVEMDIYSQGRRAMRSYGPKYPLPPPVSFIDHKK